MIRVAVDAMGGDHAPQAEIEGAVRALAKLPATFVIQLVGRYGGGAHGRRWCHAAISTTPARASATPTAWSRPSRSWWKTRASSTVNTG